MGWQRQYEQDKRAHERGERDERSEARAHGGWGEAAGPNGKSRPAPALC